VTIGVGGGSVAVGRKVGVLVGAVGVTAVSMGVLSSAETDLHPVIVKKAAIRMAVVRRVLNCRYFL